MNEGNEERSKRQDGAYVRQEEGTVQGKAIQSRQSDMRGQLNL